MTKVTCDDVLQLQLDQLRHEIEVCDKSGKTLGRFLPEQAYGRLLAQAEFTEEELQRAENQPGGMTTAELQKYLRSL